MHSSKYAALDLRLIASSLSGITDALKVSCDLLRCFDGRVFPFDKLCMLALGSEAFSCLLVDRLDDCGRVGVVLLIV